MRILPNTLLLLGATLLALAAGEGLARLFLPPLPNVKIREDPAAAERRRAEIAEGRVFEAERSAIGGLYVYTPTGLRLRANTLAEVRHHHISGRSVEVRTNSLGYRNREIGPKTRRRVLFLGDSITLAGYVDEEETFVRLVERLSEEEGEPLETINAGVGGIGIADELAVLTETGLGTDPDVVVVDFYLNDARPSPAVWLIPPPRWASWSRLGAYALLAAARLRDRGRTDELPEKMPDLKAWLAQVRRDFPGDHGDLLRERRALNLAIERNFRDWGCAWSEGAWERMTPVLREFRRLADLHGFALRIVAFPLRVQVEADYLADEPQRRLAAVCAELSIPLLDLLPILRAAHRQGAGPLFYDHCHPTPRGHALIARRILEFLREADREARPR